MRGERIHITNVILEADIQRYKVMIEDADSVFTTLMGPEVGPRRKFIQTHAKGVKNLDI